jgi:hypothetical protein
LIDGVAFVTATLRQPFQRGACRLVDLRHRLGRLIYASAVSNAAPAALLS